VHEGAIAALLRGGAVAAVLRGGAVAINTAIVVATHTVAMHAAASLATVLHREGRVWIRSGPNHRVTVNMLVLFAWRR
jgi:hypothetical protein